MKKYAIHTTANPEWHKFVGWTEELKMDAAGDCFYGWGEPPARTRDRCIGHTVIYGMDLEDARSWARILVGDGYQVVVTEHDDWSQVITDSKTPIHYRAAHQH